MDEKPDLNSTTMWGSKDAWADALGRPVLGPARAAVYIERNEVALRDEFAKAALTGLLSSKFMEEWPEWPHGSPDGQRTILAGEAYLLAEAMLAERARRRDG